MDREAVKRFLAAVPEVSWPGDGLDGGETSDERQAVRFRDLARTMSISCPDELVALEEAAEGRRIFAGQWELLDGVAARYELENLRRQAAVAPCLAAHTRMLPVFSADGDLLLLDERGAVRRCSFDSGDPYGDHGTVMPSFAALLRAFADGERLGEPPRGWSAWHHVDGVEYQVSVGHHHERRGERPVCLTTLSGDLAPHYHRWPDGPGSRPLDGHVERARAGFVVELAGDPVRIPRERPLYLVETAGAVVDLRVELERSIRGALDAGWTGRDGRRVSVDGWALFGVTRPATADL